MRVIFAAACAALALGCANRPASPVVAEGGGLRITLDQLDERVRDTLLQERTHGQPARLYELRSDVLDTMVADRVLAAEAKRRGMDVHALIESEAAPVTDDDVRALFEKNRARLPEGTTLEAAGPSIRKHLAKRNAEAATRKLVAAANVAIHLEPPRLDVAAEGPSLGPPDAPVTIIEFGDFQCPFCGKVEPILEELLRRYPKQVRLVYRHLPLESIHPRARAAAEASACAEDQGHFWEFHNALFANQKALGDADLRARAKALDLDLAAYDTCVKQRTHRARVAADIRAARKAGIEGTPAFVVNGVLLVGVQSLDTFEELIQHELRTAPSGRAATGSPATP